MLEVGLHDHEGAGAGEGALAGEHLVEHGAEGVDVGASVDPFTADALGGHVGRGAGDHAGPGHGQLAGEPGGAGDAEVEDLDELGVGGALCEEDVLGLQVAVHDVEGVGLADRAAHGVDDAEGPLDVELAFVVERLPQVAAAQVLHGDVEEAVFGVPEVVHGDGVLAAQQAGGLGLDHESAHGQGVRGGLPPEDLHGDDAVDRELSGAVHGAEAAAADQALDDEAVVEHAPDQRILGDPGLQIGAVDGAAGLAGPVEEPTTLRAPLERCSVDDPPPSR